MTDNENTLAKAHKRSMHNRQSLESTERCGCFHCQAQFNPCEITEWTDEGTTALCPHCGIDSVLSSADVEYDADFLEAMHKRYFEVEVTVKT